MRHSLWWLLGQFVIVMVAGTVIIAAVVAVWYGLSFVLLAAIGRLFPLRAKTRTPPDRNPIDGPMS